VLAYSGDTEWTDALLSVATGADLFIVECYEHARAIPGHMSWTQLSERLSALGARKIMVTHMNPSMLSKIEEVRASGVLIASDGLVLEL
jgi:ribonuclease BN (tRNA processing enzyme)